MTNEKYATIGQLLDALDNPNDIKLENTPETWRRIAEGDSFDELGLSRSELDEFLAEWCENNEYANI